MKKVKNSNSKVKIGQPQNGRELKKLMRPKEKLELNLMNSKK